MISLPSSPHESHPPLASVGPQVQRRGSGSPAWEVVTGEQLMFVRISLHRAVGSGGVGFLGKEEEAGAP